MTFRRCLTTLLATSLTALVAVPGLALPASAAEGGPSRLMLVLDSSGSMKEPAGGGQTKIDAAKTALRNVVGDLPEDSEVGLRVFGATVFSRTDAGSCEDTQRVVDPATGNRDALLQAIDSYKPFGETPIPNALREAAKDLGSEGQRSMLLVSDGESTCAPDPCEVADELAKAGIDLHIDVVGLGVTGKARDQLQCIADKGNGTYYDATTADEIEQRLSRAAQRAIRPFQVTGTPIVGGGESNPTPVEVGEWTDTLGPQDSDTGTRHYSFERTTEGTTLRVSAVTQGANGDEGLRIELFNPAGERCVVSGSLRQIDAREVVGVQALTSEANECDQPGTYRIAVSRRLAREHTVAFGLRVAEEPPVTDVGFVPPTEEAEVADPQVAGAAQPVVGGTSFDNAAQIGPGSWTSTVVPGEVQLYRFALEFGQAARIKVSYPAATAAMREKIEIIGPLSEIALYNPMHARLSSPRGADFSGRAGKDPLDLLTATPAVSRELIDTGGTSSVADYSTSGDYTLAVSMMREDYTIEFPFTISVEIVGEPADGPTYAGGATWTVADGVSGGTSPSPSADPSESPEVPADDDTEDDGSTLRTVGGVVAGLVGVGVIGAGLLMLRRRTAG